MKSSGRRLGIASVSMVVALLLTHALWAFLQRTPFLLGFCAAVLASYVGGRASGAVAIATGVVGYLLFPLPLPQAGPQAILLGFVAISSTFVWFVCRHNEGIRAVKSAEARLRETQQAANFGSWESSLADGADWWSEQVYRILGVEAGEVPPNLESFLRLVHPDDRPIVDSILQRAIADRQPFQCDARIVRADGEVRTVHIQGGVALGDDQQVERVMGTVQDITDQVRVRHALHEAEERMRFALEAARLGVWEANLLTGTSYWSETCEVLHGLAPGTFGQTLSAFLDRVHPDDRESVFNTIDKSVREHRDAILEYRTIWPDGTERYISSNGYFFYSDAGVPVRGAGVSIDVTERRLLEAELRQSHKMEAVGLLAGGIAHDFNNLLTAIGGYAELVMRTLDEGDARREDLHEVVKASDRASALTRRLLAVSRRQVLQPTLLDLNAMVVDLQKLLRRTIPEHIDVQLQLGRVNERVLADRGQLEQVVLNVVINASDAMPRGGQLRIGTDIVDVDDAWAQHQRPMPAGRYVRLSVSDTGTGMTPETQARIFEPFFTTKERGRGTGLGLAMVYGIVKQSDGFIAVESHVGRGTTVDMYFPVGRVPGEPASQVPVLRASARPTHGSRTILLAEDEDSVRRLASDVLTRSGYTVMEARDGEEALAIARGYPYTIELLVTDIVMPGLSGLELAAQLIAERADLRVLYMSGYPENVMMQVGFEHELTFLAKPFMPDDLLREVAEKLDGRTAQATEQGTSDV